MPTKMPSGPMKRSQPSAHGRLDGDLDRRIADDFGLVVLALRLEQLETGHRDDARRVTGLVDQRLGGERDLHLGAGGEQGHLGVALGGGDLVGAAGAGVVLDELGAQRRQVLAGQRQQARRVAAFQRQLPALEPSRWRRPGGRP